MLRFLRGQSTLEFISLITFLIIVFFVFQKFVVRGFVGRWKATGDTWSHGRQYDPDLTVNCKYIQVFDSGGKVVDQYWFDEDCYDPPHDCWDACNTAKATKAGCNSCRKNCPLNKAVCNDAAVPPAI